MNCPNLCVCVCVRESARVHVGGICTFKEKIHTWCAWRPEVNWSHSSGTRLVYLRHFLSDMDLIKQATRWPMSLVELVSALSVPPLLPTPALITNMCCHAWLFKYKFWGPNSCLMFSWRDGWWLALEPTKMHHFCKELSWLDYLK